MRKPFSRDHLEFIPDLNSQHTCILQAICLLNDLDQTDEEHSHISNPLAAQQLLLFKRRKELSRKVEKKVVPKILEDVDYMLKEECAQQVSRRDLNHVHLCEVSPDPKLNIDALLSDDNVRLLYHTCEEWFQMPYCANRNVKSSLAADPEVIPFDYEEYTDRHGFKGLGFSKAGISSRDLGWSEYGKIEFEEDSTGLYRLKNGTRLKMEGLLPVYRLLHGLDKVSLPRKMKIPSSWARWIK